MYNPIPGPFDVAVDCKKENAANQDGEILLCIPERRRL